MNDEIPFAPFVPGNRDMPEAPARKKRGPRKGAVPAKPAKNRRAATSKEEAAFKAVTEGALSRKRAPRPTQVSITVLPALTGLRADEVMLLLGILQSLDAHPKKGRQRVVEALAKILA